MSHVHRARGHSIPPSPCRRAFHDVWRERSRGTTSPFGCKPSVAGLYVPPAHAVRRKGDVNEKARCPVRSLRHCLGTRVLRLRDLRDRLSGGVKRGRVRRLRRRRGRELPRQLRTRPPFACASIGVPARGGSMFRTALTVVTLTIAAAAGAQGYPNRPVRVVVPWPPGQATDIAARV